MVNRTQRHEFPIIVEQDENGFFVATNPAFPGCYTQGRNIEEALQNVREATEACLVEGVGSIPSIANVSLHVISV